jgi:hypothetical protein
VLAGADVERRHTYRVANASKRPVKVARVVNMKPCCGDVEPVGPTVLEPGQGLDVTVTLKIGPASGQLQHGAVIESDDPDSPEIELTTLANCLPRAAIDEVVSADRSILPGETTRAEFVIHSYGDATTPPLPLDERTIRCDASIAWSGPQSREVDPETGSTEHRRGLVITLQAQGEQGDRATDLFVMDAHLAVARKRITWGVASALKATPTGLVVTSDEGESVRKVVLRSQDGKPFRISSATSRVDGLKVQFPDDGARAVHLLEVRIGPPSRPGLRTGEILVATDHPRQPEAKIAVYIAGRPEGVPSPKEDSR